ncbi:hypothetical protein Hanom_Chr17g01568301 [Helianthus anomalus]
MGKWTEKNVLNLKRILRCLYLVSGIKVSLVRGVGVDEGAIENMANVFGYKKGPFHFNFLGLSIGENMKRIKPWKPVIDKFAKKLSSWKAGHLSMGGRITLAKAVLGNLPAYFLLIFKAPAKVIKTLEGLRWDFVWGKTSSRNKLRWVAWKKNQTPKKLGGLGLGDITSLNWGLLLKRKWWIKSDPDQLWVRVIQAIHGDNGRDQETPGTLDLARTWKDINSVLKDGVKAEL